MKIRTLHYEETLRLAEYSTVASRNHSPHRNRFIKHTIYFSSALIPDAQKHMMLPNSMKQDAYLSEDNEVIHVSYISDM